MASFVHSGLRRFRCGMNKSSMTSTTTTMTSTTTLTTTTRATTTTTTTTSWHSTHEDKRKKKSQGIKIIIEPSVLVCLQPFRSVVSDLSVFESRIGENVTHSLSCPTIIALILSECQDVWSERHFTWVVILWYLFKDRAIPDLFLDWFFSLWHTLYKSW